MLSHAARQNLRHQIDQATRAKVFVDPICPRCLKTFSRYRTYQVFCSDNCRKVYHQQDRQRARQVA